MTQVAPGPLVELGMPYHIYTYIYSIITVFTSNPNSPNDLDSLRYIELTDSEAMSDIGMF